MKNILVISAIWILSIVGCDSSATEYGLAKLPIETSISHEGMVFTLSLSQKTFNLTDTLYGKYTVTNKTGSTKQFNFSNVQQNGFRVYDITGEAVLFYPQIVSPALSSFEIQNGQTKEFLIYTTFKNHTGSYIKPNEYKFAAYLLNNNSPAVELSISIQ